MAATVDSENCLNRCLCPICCSHALSCTLRKILWTLARPLPTTLLVLEDVEVNEARAVDSDSVFIEAKEEVLRGSRDLVYGEGLIAFVYGQTSIMGSFVHSSYWRTNMVSVIGNFQSVLGTLQ